MTTMMRVFGWICAALMAAAARAELRLPNVFSDHGVLQRERPIHVWGWAAPGAELTARFHEQTVSTEADRLGKWSLWLQPEHAGGPYVLTVQGDGGKKTVRDLLVGDVWLASGQSNMEMPLRGFPPSAVVKNGDQEIAAANNPRLRLLLIPHKSSDVPESDVSATWTECTTETAKTFSAIAYFFGREIAAKENVPIGLIDSTWGGTPADAWTSMDTLGSNPALLPAFRSRAILADAQPDMNAIRAAEKLEDEQAKAAGKPAPRHPYHPDPVSWQPAGLYDAMIAPLTPLSLKGFLWYQGETNSAPDRAPAYEALFTAMIGDWRSHFRQGTLPFLYVQISSYDSPNESWGLVREAQRRTLQLSHTAMAVTLDVGTPNNVHPPDKQTVAARLALTARHLVYGEDVVYQGPSFREATTEQAKDGVSAMRVWFDSAKGLNFGKTAAGGFELAGPDRHFVPAQAKIEGETVRVSAADVPRPTYVRYGWAGVVQSSLYNSAGLPASTFTSERDPR